MRHSGALELLGEHVLKGGKGLAVAREQARRGQQRLLRRPTPNRKLKRKELAQRGLQSARTQSLGSVTGQHSLTLKSRSQSLESTVNTLLP
jgi:hypothetical protein